METQTPSEFRQIAYKHRRTRPVKSSHHFRASGMMPGLLDLPNELIQKIIFYTFLPPFPAPAAHHDASPSDWIPMQFEDPRYFQPGLGGKIFCNKHLPILRLRLVCSRLRVLVDDVWQRRGDESRRAEVDLISDEKADIYVTWLWVPSNMCGMRNRGWTLDELKIRARVFAPVEAHHNFKITVLDFFPDALSDLIHQVYERGPRPIKVPDPTARRPSTGGKPPRRVNDLHSICINFEDLNSPLPASFRLPSNNCWTRPKLFTMMVEGLFGGKALKPTKRALPESWQWGWDTTTKQPCDDLLIEAKRLACWIEDTLAMELDFKSRVDGEGTKRITQIVRTFKIEGVASDKRKYQDDKTWAWISSDDDELQG